MNLEFDAKAHLYWLDGQPVPSVTQVLGSLYSFAGIPPAVLEHKRQIGEALHAAIELDCQDSLDESTIDPAVTGYFEGWRLFRKETQYNPFYEEKRVASLKLRYAGTLDLAGHIDGKEALIDAKTTLALHPAVALQTAAYLNAAVEMDLLKSSAKRYALRLYPDGTYSLDEYRDKSDIHVFTAALSLFNWRHRNKLPEIQ